MRKPRVENAYGPEGNVRLNPRKGLRIIPSKPLVEVKKKAPSIVPKGAVYKREKIAFPSPAKTRGRAYVEKPPGAKKVKIKTSTGRRMTKAVMRGFDNLKGQAHQKKLEYQGAVGVDNYARRHGGEVKVGHLKVRGNRVGKALRYGKAGLVGAGVLAGGSYLYGRKKQKQAQEQTYYE